MIAIDPYIIEFVTKNPVTIGLGLATLKVIAKLTPGTTDDKIVTLLGNMVKAVRPKTKAVESQ